MSLFDAFQYVGDSLDKATGSRALRGLLGGKPRELLSVVPFSDRIGLTDERDITSGRQLTDDYGITSRSDKGWGAWGAGLAADMLLDPSNLVGGAAVRKLGKFDFGRNADDLGRASRSGSDFSLGLKYDDPAITRPEQVGLTRTDPEWVNNRTFYHGTGTPGLKASDLDPMKTSPSGLHGRGIYTSDEASFRPNSKITPGYARARSGLTLGLVRRLLAGELGDKYPMTNWHELAGMGVFPKELVDEFGTGSVYNVADTLLSGGTDPREAATGKILRKLAEIRGVEFPSARPVVYQAQSDFGRILDLDSPMQESEIASLAKQIEGPVRYLSDGSYAPNWQGMADSFSQVLPDGSPPSSGDILSRAMDRLDESSQSPDMVWYEDFPDAITSALKSLDYDALTHTGGGNTSNPYHQVVIGLDPNDVFRVGRATPYRRWEEYRRLMPDFYSDFSLGGPARHPLSPTRNQMFDPFPGEPDALNRAAMALGPQYPGGADRLLELLDRAGVEAGVRDYAKQHIDYARANLDPDTMGRIASEIPEDASPLSMGYESVVFAAPDGRVVRVGNDRYNSFMGVPQGRPDLPAMLQPVRSANYGPYQVEHLNRVTPLDTGGHALDAEKDLVRQFLDTEARAANLYPSDTGFRNLGLTDQGRALAIDGGAFGAPYSLLGQQSQVYRPPALEYPTASQVRELLAMGAPDAVRESIARGIGLRAANQGVDVPGGPDLLARIRALAGMPPVAAPPRPSPSVGNRPIDLGALMGGSDFSLAAALPMPSVGRVGAPSSIRDLLSGTLIARNQTYSPQKLAGMNVPDGAQGWYNPSTDAIVQLAGVPNPGGVRRHEMAHAMVANANRAGSTAALPMALKPSAWLRQAGYTPAGRWLEELAAAGLSQRGTSSQLLAALGAATDGPMMNAYADVIGAGPGLRGAMGVAPALWRNRVPLGIGALSLNELSMLANSLGREE